MSSAAASEAVEVLLSFGASMLRAGNTAIATREWIEVIARKMGFDAVSVSLSIDSITASVGRDGESATAMREVGPPGVNAWRTAELVLLAQSVEPETALPAIAVKLAEIESMAPRYSAAQLIAAVAAASGAFAFLNGVALPELLAAAIGGGFGQGVRLWLSRRHVNHYGTAAVAAVAASGMFVLTAVLARAAGIEFAHYSVGLIASVLFLVPGVPLIAALIDLLHYQTVAAVSRLAYGVMVLLAVAFGLSIVIAVAGIDLSRPPPLDLSYSLKLSLRAVASFVAGGAFAMLFNALPRTVFSVGILALGANSLRLGLIDMGITLAAAAFFSALAIGLVSLLAGQRFNVPRMAMIVAPIVIMIPGIYAFEMIVLFNQGQMLDALQASAACGFVVGALAMGLATARLFSPNSR